MLKEKQFKYVTDASKWFKDELNTELKQKILKIADNNDIVIDSLAREAIEKYLNGKLFFHELLDELSVTNIRIEYEVPLFDYNFNYGSDKQYETWIDTNTITLRTFVLYNVV